MAAEGLGRPTPPHRGDRALRLCINVSAPRLTHRMARSISSDPNRCTDKSIISCRATLKNFDHQTSTHQGSPFRLLFVVFCWWSGGCCCLCRDVVDASTRNNTKRSRVSVFSLKSDVVSLSPRGHPPVEQAPNMEPSCRWVGK